MRRWQEREHPRDRRGRFAEKGEWVASLDAHLHAKLSRVYPRSDIHSARAPAVTGPEVGRILRAREIASIQRRQLVQDQARQDARVATMQRSLDMAREQRDAASIEDGMEDMRRRGIPEGSPAWDKELSEIKEFIAGLDARVQRNVDAVEKAKATPRVVGIYSDADLDQDVDSHGPLAPYGDMLHVDSSEFSAGILEALETIEPRFHRVVAEHMAEVPGSGIYVGAVPLTQLDDLRTHLAGSPSGDWETVPGASWDDVNGAVHYGSRVMGVALSENALHRGMGRATAIHEFGHALDDALTKISQAQEWYSIHKIVVRTSTHLSPHFKRDNSAGRSELWAESFYLWHAWQDDQRGFEAAFADSFGLRMDSPAIQDAWQHFRRVSDQLMGS